MKIELPDLESETDVEIVSDNLYAIAAIYFSNLLEEMRFFQVVERIIELFHQGLLPVGRGHAGDTLANYWRSDKRLTESERRDLYVRILGAPGASEELDPNREFLSLWMRFLVAVSAYVRERGPDELVWPPSRLNARVRGSARALAANLSARGDEAVQSAAEQLAAQERLAFIILGDPDIQSAFGARDAWEVVDRLGRELGEARNVTRYRTQAEAGARALRWLARHSDSLKRTAEEAGPDAERDSAELIEAAERWLAASGLPDDAVEQYSTPTESPNLPFPPIDLPAVAQDLLAAVGVSSDDSSRPNATILFEGARRTGKTLAVYLLAQALSREVLRIDLDKVVSTYIGETEKNIDAIFEAAEQSNAILLFEEADALFGRGPDVQDANDRYANLDVADLLRRIERYKGIAILATNSRDDDEDNETRRGWRSVRFPLRKRGP